MRSVTAILFLGFSLAPPAEARTNYRNQLAGGRAALLGGAFTAVADDASAVVYNPAGLIYVPGASVSGSANVYSANFQTYRSTIGTQDWNRNAENLTPSYLAVSKRQDRWAFGAGYFLVDMVKENQNQIFENRAVSSGTISTFSLELNTEDTRNLIGFAAAYEASDALSLGLTLGYTFRHYLKHQDQFTKYTDTDTEHAFDFQEIKAKGVKPILGALWSPAERWSVGFTATKEVVFSQLKEDVRNRLDKGSTAPAFVRQTDTGKEKTPLETSLGVAFFRSHDLLFSLDASYFLESDASRNDVINLALGAEYFTSPAFALRGGLFTNRTNVKELTSASRNLDQRAHIYGVSAGCAFFTNASELTAGAVVSSGKGELQPFSGSTSIRDFSYFDLKLLLASSYNF